MCEFVLDKTLVLIGLAARSVLVVTLLLVNFSCYLSLAKIWCEKHGGNCLLSRSYLDTLQPSTKVCPGKIWSVHTYHNYISPNIHLGCQYVPKMNNWGVHRLYVSMPHTVFCERESRLWPCNSRDERMRIYIKDDGNPLLFCAKEAIASIWWLPALN